MPFHVEDVGVLFEAKFAGSCPYCGEPWRPGDWIGYAALYDPDSGEGDPSRPHCGSCVEMFRRASQAAQS